MATASTVLPMALPKYTHLIYCTERLIMSSLSQTLELHIHITGCTQLIGMHRIGSHK
jgi:hypothetical protein